jgi:hypothetical protein
LYDYRRDSLLPEMQGLWKRSDYQKGKRANGAGSRLQHFHHLHGGVQILLQGVSQWKTNAIAERRFCVQA